ncbi:AraC family transcriptional regulator ligand-binding domain-containing protein [Lentzea xinjiangensis]|uniref:AraC family transcriptional regulator ligand-binding domain-containing protein n=1 Tax=Lentzea xinjiangensis TaxID=402600 RepID=UPI000B7CDF3A|nr:AraC family transcriptional regulator ligand-binding domain-containing protein [Lentzea xinjiangensis]
MDAAHDSLQRRRLQLVFGCPVTFGAAADCVVFPAWSLALPIATRREPTRAVAVDACRRLLTVGATRPEIVVPSRRC